uniref:Uncharacterized protein n=1 Tax=Arundo donax TaxID=35708 RepID=A0A0A9FIK9_ARUDO
MELQNALSSSWPKQVSKNSFLANWLPHNTC